MKNLKLNVLANQNLSGKEMNSLKGGASCCCGCIYKNEPGGSSTSANDSANEARGLSSPNCLPEVVITPKKRESSESEDLATE